MAFRRTPASESFALVAPNLDLVEITVFPGREDAIISHYTVKLADGHSWYAPKCRDKHTTREAARTCWSTLKSEGWKPRSQQV
jgi:hypothetical protein